MEDKLTKDLSLVEDAMDLEDGYIDPKRERQLTRKLDLFIAPIMTVVFLNAYLDRANIGNAASAGMLTDLHMSDGELGSTHSLRLFVHKTLVKTNMSNRCHHSILCHLCGL